MEEAAAALRRPRPSPKGGAEAAAAAAEIARRCPRAPPALNEDAFIPCLNLAVSFFTKQWRRLAFSFDEIDTDNGKIDRFEVAAA